MFTVKNSLSLIWDTLLYVKDYKTHLIFLKERPGAGGKTKLTPHQTLKPKGLEP